MTAPSGNDTHADTPEAALVVEEALRKGKSYVTPGGLKHWPALDAFRAYRRALVADLERERARADQAEAALADATQILREHAYDDGQFTDHPRCIVCTWPKNGHNGPGRYKGNEENTHEQGCSLDEVLNGRPAPRLRERRAALSAGSSERDAS